MTESILEITRKLDFDEDVDPSALPDHLAKCLEEVSASTVEVSDNRVAFTAGWFRFVSNLNVLNAMGKGEITIDAGNHEVEYRLSLRQLVVCRKVTITS